MKGARPLLRVLAAPIVLLRGGFQVANGLPAGCTAATFKRRQEHVALKLCRPACLSFLNACVLRNERRAEIYAF
jgi:hypothetical protein